MHEIIALETARNFLHSNVTILKQSIASEHIWYHNKFAAFCIQILSFSDMRLLKRYHIHTTYHASILSAKYRIRAGFSPAIFFDICLILFDDDPVMCRQIRSVYIEWITWAGSEICIRQSNPHFEYFLFFQRNRSYDSF